MLEIEPAPAPSEAELERVFSEAPRGAFMIAGIACALVGGIWLLFYLLVFLPRGVLQ